MALEITDESFEDVVLKSDKPVMVDFWAAWCGPCRMVGPIIEELSADFDGRAHTPPDLSRWRCKAPDRPGRQIPGLRMQIVAAGSCRC